jgi:hypothetical protein
MGRELTGMQSNRIGVCRMIWRALAFVALIASTLLPIATQASPAAHISPPVLKWTRGGCQTTWCRTGWYASPAVADIDGDGSPEVVWTDYRMVVVNGEDGSDQWVASNPGGGRGWPGVVVADIDEDRDLEIISAHSDGWVAVYQDDGSAYPGWPKQLTPGNELRSLAADDVDGDGDLEILAASTRPDNQWFLLEHTGAIRDGWPVHSPDSDDNGFAAGCFNENVGLADLNGDGHAEVIGPNDTHYIAAFYEDGSPIRANAIYGLVGGQNKPWARVGFHLDHSVDLRGYANCSLGEEPLEPRPNFADSAPTLADVDGDGTLEIIVVGNQYDCRTSPYTSLFQMPYILNIDRTRWADAGLDWTILPVPDDDSAPLSEDYDTIETAQPNPAVVDLDGDGHKEILYASYDGRVHAYWLDKTEHGSWPFEVTNPGEGFIRFASEPAVVDLDNSGQAEVIFSTWTEKGSDAGGQLLIVTSLGVLLYGVDLPRGEDSSWDGALSAPTIASIDSDPDLEVILGTSHTGLVAYDLPGTSEARILWGTGRGSDQRTGAIIPPVATFQDVSVDHWAWRYIEALHESGITSGCSPLPLKYCPDDLVTRAQMAIFLERGIHGSDYTPPSASGSVFNDAPGDHWAADWIEQLAVEGITSGCSTDPPLYCPEDPVTRAQMAVLLERAGHWPDIYTPPDASGTVFEDVPESHWAAGWIEQLFADEITSGCSADPLMYCPESAVTRSEMAVFLVRTFNLPMP